LFDDTSVAVAVPYPVVAVELLAIAWIRRRFLRVSLSRSLIQVTLGGVLISAVGVLLGHA